MRRLTIIVSTAGLVGGLIALAPSASAAGIAIDCAADAGHTVAYTMYATAGEVITLTNVGQACAGSAVGPFFTETSPMDGAQVTFQVDPDAPDGVYGGTLGSWESWQGIVVGAMGPTSYITVVVGPPGASSPPPSSYQQIPLPASGSCADVHDTDLAYGTGLTGGWTRQWGEWADGGRGAVVCGRTIAWIDGAWSTQAP